MHFQASRKTAKERPGKGKRGFCILDNHDAIWYHIDMQLWVGVRYVLRALRASPCRFMSNYFTHPEGGTP